MAARRVRRWSGRTEKRLGESGEGFCPRTASSSCGAKLLAPCPGACGDQWEGGFRQGVDWIWGGIGPGFGAAGVDRTEKNDEQGEGRRGFIFRLFSPSSLLLPLSSLNKLGWKPFFIAQLHLFLVDKIWKILIVCKLWISSS